MSYTILFEKEEQVEMLLQSIQQKVEKEIE